MIMTDDVAYADNRLAGNGTHVQGGKPIGFSLCDRDTCASPPLRSYYLTKTMVAADAATTACATGFHLASLWEIFDPSALRYDTTLGFNDADFGLGFRQGSGPPAFGSSTVGYGWALTGSHNGAETCSGYSDATSGAGTWASLRTQASLADPATRSQPWEAVLAACTLPQRVWCVQD